MHTIIFFYDCGIKKFRRGGGGGEIRSNEILSGLFWSNEPRAAIVIPAAGLA